MTPFQIFGLACLLTFCAPDRASADDFCDGYQRGWEIGYMQSSGSSLKPLSPLCPLQPLKKLNDPQEDYEQGYIVGFQDGIAAGF